MTVTYQPLTSLDTFDVLRLLDLSTRAAITGEDWRTVVEATRPGASVDQRVAGMLLLAGPLMDVVEPADEEVLLRAFLPRISVADRQKALADVREELDQAERFAGISDAGELYDALDLNHGCFSDWVRVAEDETEKWRQSAAHVARQACEL